MTKILFAASKYGNPILGTNDDWFKEDVDMNGCDLDDHVPSQDVVNLAPGLYVWEGERRENWICKELDIQLVKREIRPATRQDLDELGFACQCPIGHMTQKAMEIAKTWLRGTQHWPNHLTAFLTWTQGDMKAFVEELDGAGAPEPSFLHQAVDALYHEDLNSAAEPPPDSFLAKWSRVIDQM